MHRSVRRWVEEKASEKEKASKRKEMVLWVDGMRYRDGTGLFGYFDPLVYIFLFVLESRLVVLLYRMSLQIGTGTSLS